MAFPPPPAGLDLTETQAPRVIGVSVSTYIIALTCVVLRLVCRRLLRARLWWDDAFILIALVAATGMLFTVDAFMIPNNFGKHVWVGSPNSSEVWAIGLWVQEILYPFVLAPAKFSLLAFYWRLFAPGNLRIPIFVLGAIVSAWGIALIFITIFQCNPPAAFWERFSPTVAPAVKATFKCGVNDKNFFIGNSIPNIITDIAILVLPLKVIWALQLPNAKKIAISSIMLLGAFVIGVSIARFTYLMTLDLTSPDVTYNFVEVQVWTNVECCIGIACACLPSLGPLFNLITSGSAITKRSSSQRYGGSYATKSWKSVASGDGLGVRSGAGTYSRSSSEFRRLNDMRRGPHDQHSDAHDNELHEMRNGIMVSTNVSVG